MIPVQVVLHYFHGFQLFQTGFLGNLILRLHLRHVPGGLRR